MELWGKFLAAFDEYKAKNFDAALKLVDELKKSAPELKKIFMLEAWIFFEREEYLRAFDVLEKLLPRLNLSSPYEKLLTAQSLNRMGQICDALTLTEQAIKFYRLAAKLYDDKSKACMAQSNAIFIANAAENFSRENFAELYAEYKNFLADIKPYPKKFYAHEKIRVGFLSADFRRHVVMNWSFALVTGLDKNFFATYCYSASKIVDDLTQKIFERADVWHDVSDLTDEELAEKIHDDEIDILVDLSGHSAGNRLRAAAFKPASVQISGVGYVNSTGLNCFDYFLSDNFCAGDESWFTEKLIRLPHSHICFEPFNESEIFLPPKKLSQKNFVTFGSFNNFAKVTDGILSVWKKILDAVPNSKLLLKHKILSTTEGKIFVGERLKNFGFDLRRIEMRGYSANHLREYADVDIALDTFPYVGGVTTCEALWMGVPVVSMYGSRHGTRIGLSILKNVGLDELAVATVDEYISRAVMLAGDKELLELLRKNLRGLMKKSPLMDTKNYVRNVEIIFAEILLAAQKNFVD